MTPPLSRRWADLVLVLASVACGACAPYAPVDRSRRNVVDERDGLIYPTVALGGHAWLARDLQGARLRAGGDTGFGAPISGYRRPDGEFARRGERSAYWTATEADADSAWHRDIRSDDGRIYRSAVPKDYSLSVRCIEDQRDSALSTSDRGDAWLPAYAPAPVARSTGRLMWARTAGGPGADTAYDIWPTDSRSFVVVGSVESERGDLDLAVMKIDVEGRLQWTRRFGGTNLEIGFSVRVLADSTIAVAGWTRSFGAGAGDFYLLGLDKEGSLLFERTFGGPGEERATSLELTDDGGMAIIGETYSHGSGDGRFYLVKTDSVGVLEWERTYDGGPLNERGLALIADDDGYLLVGNSMDSRSGSTSTISDGYVVRTDRRGLESWSRRYGSDAHDIFHHGAALPSGTFVLAGYTRGFGARGESDFWLIEIGRDGRRLRARTFGGEGADHGVMVRASANGCIRLAGFSESVDGDADAHAIVLAPDLSTVRTFAYEGAGDDGASSLITLDNRFIVAGHATTERGDSDMLIAAFRDSNDCPI